MDDSNEPPSQKMPIMIRDIKAAQRDAFLDALDQLLNLLHHHPLMPSSSNPHDPRTPPPLLFTWDFVQRTRSKLSQIPIERLEANERDALEQYSDCVGRAIMAEIVVAAEKTAVGAVGAVIKGAGGGGEQMDFGYEIRKAAKAAAFKGGGEEGVRHV